MKRKYQNAEDFAADESFQDYCLGSSASAIRKWEKYLKQNRHQKDIIEEAKFFVLLLSNDVVPQQKKQGKKSNLISQRILKICAVFLLLIITSSAFIYFNNKTEEYATVTKLAESQNLSIMLTDLSKIDLRKGSEIEFKESYENSDTREVSLKGEAYFDVEKSAAKEKPFIVHLAKGNISVLGTRFLVKSDESSTQIILEEGKISFSVDGRSYVLTPGDVLTYNQEMVSILNNKKIETYDSWRKNKISFQNASISEVIQTIKNSYNLSIELGNENLKNRKITTTLDQNDPMLLLQAIAAIYDIEVAIQGDKIFLK